MNKNVLITGGNKGIGLECTKLFAGNGYNVTVVGRDFSKFEFNNLKSVNKVYFDISNINEIENLVNENLPIDILINNAGIMNSIPYDDYSDEKREILLNVNLFAPIEFIKAVSKYMIKNKYGRIVNTASVAGEIGHPDIWYGISKAGIINATKSFAKLLGSQGIIINAVAPGPVETDMLDIIPNYRKKEILENVYLKRFAKADEVAKTIYWLAVESPEYINGTCIDINNGSFPR